MCLLVLREPYQATCCGYSFCHVCIEKIKVTNKPCPCCKADSFNDFPNKGLQRSIQEFKVHCANRKEGCQWVGELGQLDNHLNSKPPQNNQVEACQYVQVQCLHCLQPFKRTTILTHQSDQCPRRPFNCKYCKTFYSHYEDVTTNHWPVCGCYPVECSNKCGETVQRQNLESHINNDCSLIPVDCDFKFIGCKEKLPRREMSTHLKEGIVAHTLLHASSHKELASTYKTEKKALEAKVTKLSREKKEQQKEIDKLKNDIQQLQVYISGNKFQQAQKMKLATDLKALQQLAGDPVGRVELLMNNFKQHKKDNNDWFSPPFYSHHRGYKMDLRVIANGIKEGAGTHISAFISIRKGEYDKDLKWPFRGEITIWLMNQEDGSHDYHTHTVRFTDKTPDGAAARVTQGTRASNCVGTSTFITHRDLQPNYLKHNTLHFRIHKVELKS